MKPLITLIILTYVTAASGQFLRNTLASLSGRLNKTIGRPFPDLQLPANFDPLDISALKGFDSLFGFDGRIFNPFQFDIDDIFGRFARKFNRNYTAEDIPQRRANLLKSIKDIAVHIINSVTRGTSFNVGLTGLSDLSDAEYKSLLGTEELPETVRNLESHRKKRATGSPFCQTSARTPPALYDARQQNLVTPVKSQNTNCQKVVTRRYQSGNRLYTEYRNECQSCGSCWAFAAVSTIETLWAKKTGQIVDLSEQDVVNCAASDGCNGSYQYTAYQYAKKYGVALEADVPYKAKSEVCQRYPLVKGVQISDYCEKGGKLNYTTRYENGRFVVRVGDVIPATDEEMMRDLLEAGSLATAINADDPLLKNYKSGIYFNSTCSTKTNHAVVTVGYGWDGGRDYWIVKNSWDASWGEGGFMRIARRDNMCGINNHYYYPVITNTNFVSKLNAL